MSAPVPEPTRRSTDRVLRVLLFLAGRPRPQSATTIAQACDIPRSSLYPMLTTMQERDFVVHFPDERTWGLGVGVFEIGSAFLSSEPLQHLGRPVLSRLTANTGETSHLAVLHGNEVLYLLKHSAPRPSTALITDTGVRLPAQLTAVGRAILTYLPRSQVRALYPDNASFVERTGQGSTRLFDLRKTLTGDKHRGYSIESDCTTVGVSCIAAAVFDHRQVPIASVGVSFATESRAQDEWSTIATGVRDAAHTLTGRLRGTSPDTTTEN